MEEKKYLKWYNKVGYGSGDIAGNVVYAFLTSFVMVYLTDTVGLASGIVGTLIAVSKLFDGFTDVFFGSLIDKTHSRLGKARPWMIYGYIGCAITLVACFAVPAGMGKAAQYTWFFIAYTLLNGVFYTANNIAYSALTSLITKNSKERVQMGSYRFIFAFSTSLLIQTITVGFVDWCGGDAAAWRLVAIIYAIVGLVVNTISGLSVKELPEKELNDGEPKETEEKYSLVQAFKLLIKNKYYIMICGTYILQQLYSAMIGAGLFYMTWVLKNKNLFGQFAWAVNIPLIIALIFTPTLVGKWKGMYKLNLRGYIIAVIGRALVVVAGYIGNIPLMLAFTALAALGQGPWQGDMNAVIASCSEYTYLTQGKRVDGTMYSCTSLGVKIGGGIGTAVVGWLLELSGYKGTMAVQPQSALGMMQFMYLWLPLIFDILILLILSRMNVEAANEKLGLTGAHSFKMLVQLLAVEHAAVPAASGQQLHGLNAALGRALCMSKDLKRCRDQCVRGQQGRSLAKLLVAARASAAEIIVVHAGHIIVNERVAVQHFQRTGIVQRIGSVGTGQLAGGQRQHGAHPFAAAQKAVARGLPQLRLLWQVFIAQRGQAFFGQTGPGGKLLLIFLMRHGAPPHPGQGWRRSPRPAAGPCPALYYSNGSARRPRRTA